MKSAFLITAPHSGSGKTTLSLGISRFLARRGSKVQAFKVGPDYIDSSLLSKASLNDVYNIDRLLMKDSDIKRYFYKAICRNDVAIVEGVMGLFDSFDSINFYGSSADIAIELNLPILLVINAAPSLTYYTMIIKGIEGILKNYHTKIGLVINMVKKNSIDERIANSIEYHTGGKLLGFLPEDEDIKIFSRHLGLITGEEIGDEILDKLSDSVCLHIDMGELLNYFSYENQDMEYCDIEKTVYKKDKICRIAKDRAFNFYYKNNLDMIENYGYNIKYFSPLNNEEVLDADLIYLGGGYPEIYAEDLGRNFLTINSLRKNLLNGVPIFAECGGFIYLGKDVWIDGKKYPMAGIFDISFEMTKNLQMLGYVSVEFQESNCFFNSDEQYYGHQFRYSRIKESDEYWVTKVKKLGKDIEFMDGAFKNRCFGSYTHFNFSSANILERLSGVRL